QPPNPVAASPGAPALTRMEGARARASDFVSAPSAAFDAAYAIEDPCPVNAATEVTLTIAPPPRRSICGTAARTQQKAPSTLTAHTLSSVSSVRPARCQWRWTGVVQ